MPGGDSSLFLMKAGKSSDEILVGGNRVHAMGSTDTAVP